MSDIELPDLPKSVLINQNVHDPKWQWRAFTINQMQDYARAALAKVPEQLAGDELAIEAGWRAAINIHSQQGMGGWSAYREEGFEYARQLLDAARTSGEAKHG